MYKGKKDAHLTIRVPMELCFAITNDSGEWIEVMVPPSDFVTNKSWASFLVRPNQVFWDDECNNRIEGILKNASIKCCEHFNDENGIRRIVPGTEFNLDPFDVMKYIERYIYLRYK